MPLHEYRTKGEGCPSCREPFEVLQRQGERALRRCPECGGAVEKVPSLVNSSFPKGPAELRNLGFARLEKRSDGNYENVSAQPGAQKVGSLDSFSDSLTKGPKKIVSD